MAYIPKGITGNAENTPKAQPSGEKPRDTSRIARLSVVMTFITIVAVGFAVYSLAVSAHRYAVLDENTGEAIVATRDIQSGEAIDGSSVAIAELPLSIVTSGATADPDEVIDHTALANLPKGSVIDTSNVSGVESGTLSGRIEEGKLALSASVTQQTGVSGLVRRGDRVTLFGDVGAGVVELAKGAEVLAADADLDGDAKDYTALTVAVTPHEAQQVASALGAGQVTFAVEPAASQI